MPVSITSPGGGGTPGGSSGQIQYNNGGAFGGAVWSSVALSGTLFTITSQHATDIPLAIVAASGQTANLQEWRDSGNNPLLSIDPSGSIFLGTNIFIWTAINSGGQNLFVGELSGSTSINAFATQNTGIGYFSMHNLIGGRANTCVGNQAGAHLTNGVQNTLIGYAAGNLLTTQSNNTVMGYNAAQNFTGTQSCFYGSGAGAGLQGNGNMTAIGFNAIGGSTGTDNTGVGYNCGINNITGAFNTFLGSQCNVGASNYSTSFAIGYQAIIGASNLGVLGGTGSNSVQVVINNTTAVGQFDVYINASSLIGIVVQAAGSQSANLQEWRDSGSNPLASIDPTGIVKNGGSSRVSTQFDKTSNTSLSAITGLQTTLVAGKSYGFRVVLNVSAAAAGGEVVDMGGGSATATTFISEVLVLANTTNVYSETSRQSSLTGASAGVAGDTSYFIVIEGLITVNAAGTFAPRIAQKVSNITPTSVLVGSKMDVFQIT